MDQASTINFTYINRVKRERRDMGGICDLLIVRVRLGFFWISCDRIHVGITPELRLHGSVELLMLRVKLGMR
ncbi:hypothetical protein HanPSC8_Chr11g0461631 [Helianthus annuus]|nr:hypothetical protein HanPSC8_Chr11g0461631 [Helianthus annuus]